MAAIVVVLVGLALLGVGACTPGGDEGPCTDTGVVFDLDAGEETASMTRKNGCDQLEITFTGAGSVKVLFDDGTEQTVSGGPAGAIYVPFPDNADSYKLEGVAPNTTGAVRQLASCVCE